MSKVFVGGSRRISRLSADVRKRLDQIVERQFTVLIGDANGADRAVQAYLHDCQYQRVVVFFTGGECRNNLGGWPVTRVKPPHDTRDFEYYTAKDAVMAREADYGLMIWDGKSLGTLVNIARMVSAWKLTVVYVGPKRSFVTLKSREDFQGLLSACPAEVRTRAGEYITDHAREYAQQSIF